MFGSNELAANGALLAFEPMRLSGEPHFVRPDASTPLLAVLRNGKLGALFVQAPRKLGEISVRALGKRLANEAVEPQIDTGAVLVTRENMDQPEIAALLR